MGFIKEEFLQLVAVIIENYFRFFCCCCCWKYPNWSCVHVTNFQSTWVLNRKILCSISVWHTCTHEVFLWFSLVLRCFALLIGVMFQLVWLFQELHEWIRVSCNLVHFMLFATFESMHAVNMWVSVYVLCQYMISGFMCVGRSKHIATAKLLLGPHHADITHTHIYTVSSVHFHPYVEYHHYPIHKLVFKQ